MKTYFTPKTSWPNIVFQRDICKTTEINICWFGNISPMILKIVKVIHESDELNSEVFLVIQILRHFNLSFQPIQPRLF